MSMFHKAVLAAAAVVVAELGFVIYRLYEIDDTLNWYLLKLVMAK